MLNFYLAVKIIAMKLVLASKSPRRKEILTKNGYDFTVMQADFEEEVKGDSPALTATANALGKALAVFNELNGDNAVVLGADTVVELDGDILGKPVDDRHAMSMLLRLSGRTHTVVTGWAIIANGVNISRYTVSTVTFNDLDLDEICAYVKSGLPLDKAGSYGIQDGYGLVKHYTGSLTNIIGLPIEDIKPELDKLLNE